MMVIGAGLPIRRLGQVLLACALLTGGSSSLLADAEDELFQQDRTTAPKTDRQIQQPTVSSRADLALPDVRYGEEELPAPVAETRRALIAAATSGELSQLLTVLTGRNEIMPMLDDKPVRDPIAYWKSLSFDGTGRDVLAQLLKVLRSGYVVTNAGTADETYVWPYHSAYPLDRLNPQQEVELYAIMTPREVKEMDPAEGYTGSRIGIAPNGTVRYFRVGD
jgi:hypothetical protein